MNVRSFLSLGSALAVALGCLTGCGKQDSPATVPSGTTAPAPSTQVTTPTTEASVSQEETQRRQLYDYVSSTLIPEKGLADLGPFTWTHEYKAGDSAENWEALQNAGCYGLVSAAVRDFDLDGSQDLVAFYLTALPTSDTWEPIYGQYTTADSYVVAVELYTLQNGAVTLSDSCHCLNLMDDASWGGISVYLEQLEDGIYIDSRSSATDYTTEGASPRTIFHISGGKFVFDYISGIGYGQGSISTNPNDVMGTTRMDPTEYTFSNSYSSDQTVLRLDFALEDGNAGTMVYTGTDYTQLRTILTDGLEAVELPELPQGGRKPEDPAVTATKEAAQAIADHVAAVSGCTYVETSVTTNGRVSYRYETENYSILNLTFSDSTYELTRISVANNKYPIPDEWYSMKDAIIDYPNLGLNRAELDFLYGTGVSLNAYTNGVDITGANVAIRCISSNEFIIEFTGE